MDLCFEQIRVSFFQGELLNFRGVIGVLPFIHFWNHPKNLHVEPSPALRRQVTASWRSFRPDEQQKKDRCN